MTQGELFAGIGGFGLAGRWAGIESVFQVERNNYCQKILKKNFPNAALYSDIREFDGTPYRGTIDIVSGGFPCQPYSTAGKRLGKADDRHLWPEMLRFIREVAPRWVVGENVRGLVNWSGGLVFDEVQADLEAAGYEVFAAILPAASVNAPHRRDRIWFVAYNNSNRCKNFSNKAGFLQGAIATDFIKQRSRGASKINRGFMQISTGTDKSRICRVDDGVPNRMDRVAALGNAIVPQVAYQIFKAIKDYEINPPAPGQTPEPTAPGKS